MCMKLILEEAPFILLALLSRDIFLSRKVLPVIHVQHLLIWLMRTYHWHHKCYSTKMTYSDILFLCLFTEESLECNILSAFFF